MMTALFSGLFGALIANALVISYWTYSEKRKLRYELLVEVIQYIDELMSLCLADSERDVVTLQETTTERINILERASSIRVRVGIIFGESSSVFLAFEEIYKKVRSLLPDLKKNRPSFVPNYGKHSKLLFQYLNLIQKEQVIAALKDGLCFSEIMPGLHVFVKTLNAFSLSIRKQLKTFQNKKGN
jgi:hypothetical protein